MTIALALKVLHVCANLIWIGSISAVGLILRDLPAPARDRGRIALSAYRALAMPAFIVSFVVGSLTLLLEPRYYFVQTHWMHVKLLLAVGVIALHHWLGARAKRTAAGTATPVGILPIALCDFLQLYGLRFRPIFAFFIVDVNTKRVVHVGAERFPFTAHPSRSTAETANSLPHAQLGERAN